LTLFPAPGVARRPETELGERHYALDENMRTINSYEQRLTTAAAVVTTRVRLRDVVSLVIAFPPMEERR
jgi:hypothetical protein